MFRAHVLIIRRSKLHYTASGIITPIGGRLVHVSTKRQKNVASNASYYQAKATYVFFNFVFFLYFDFY